LLIDEVRIRYERISPMLMLIDSSGRILYSSDVLNRFLGKILEGQIFSEIFQIMDSDLQVSEKLDFLNSFLDTNLLFTTKDGKLAFRGSFIDEFDGDHRRYFLLCAPWLSWIVDKSLEDILHTDQFPLQDTQFDMSAFIDTQKVMREEQEEILRSLSTAKEHAEFMTLAKSEFVEHISHQVRTPLNGVISTLRLIPGEPNDNTRKKLLDICLNSSLVLLDIVNQVLDFSSIGRDRFVGQVALFNVQELLEEVKESLSYLAAERSTILSFNIAENMPTLIECDKSSLLKILYNLVGNAINYSKSDAIIISAVARTHDQHNLELEMRVQDFGVGIKKQYHEHIFTPFWTKDRNGGSTRGTGLGLPIVKELLSREGGTLYFDSIENEGTVFLFTFPYKSQSNHSSHSATQVREFGSIKFHAKALLVDDNIVNIEIAKIVLERYGLHVVACDSGQSALEQVSKSLFDIIFMDINMPHMNGLEATSLIREKPKYEKVPIIALTANASEQHREKYIIHGLNDVLVKPISPTHLSEILDKHLSMVST